MKSDIDILIKQIAKLPALGTRSARRIVLHLLKNRQTHLEPLIESLQSLSANIKTCPICGNFDTSDICSVCADLKRDSKLICVVQDVTDLWAMERAGFFKGKYHVLGGVLSAIEGVLPQDLNVETLLSRIKTDNVQEVILALPATVDGQITAQYLISKIKPLNIKISTLALGLPVGAELDYMDDGTIEMALSSRKEV
ncbi:MAG TPA: recombination protein RecR [Alphaproteobacteria bacterium]|nr:recombination protein RecR [Alphaproteobacteria bacterium]